MIESKENAINCLPLWKRAYFLHRCGDHKRLDIEDDAGKLQLFVQSCLVVLQSIETCANSPIFCASRVYKLDSCILFFKKPPKKRLVNINGRLLYCKPLSCCLSLVITIVIIPQCNNRKKPPPPLPPPNRFAKALPIKRPLLLPSPPFPPPPSKKRCLASCYLIS